MNDGRRNLSDTLRVAAADLRAAGVPDAMIDARILASAALRMSREDMLREPEREIDPGGLARLDAMVRRRAGREPVARILGEREFRSLSFRLGPATLDPRPDSETVVEAAIAYADIFPGPVRLLDIGTGTGCLLLSALDALPDASGVGTDIAAGAIEIARQNSKLLGLSDCAEFLHTAWTEGVTGTFDIILSNPPYIPAADIAGLAPEVTGFDPLEALDGGPDGLDAFRALSVRIGECLSTPGIAVFEIGAGQSDHVAGIFATAGFHLLEIRTDLGGHPRSLAFGTERSTGWLTTVEKKGLETV